LHTQMVKY